MGSVEVNGGQGVLAGSLVAAEGQAAGLLGDEAAIAVEDAGQEGEGLGIALVTGQLGEEGDLGGETAEHTT